MELESREDLTVFDGAIGTEVQRRVSASEDNLTEILNLSRPELIRSIHHDYLSAGAQVLTTNTFSANEARLSRSGYGDRVPEINEKGSNLAREAVEEFSEGTKDLSVAGSVGPTGETLVPLGDWTFDQLYEIFHAQAKALKRGGADYIIIETMESLREAKAALLASNRIGLPVISSLSYGSKGRTSYGVIPESGAATLDHLGADVLGMNCGTGPQKYPDIIKTYSKWTSKPLLAEANAGDPRLEDGETVYDLAPEKYLEAITPGLPFLSGVGSCCGSNPDFTQALAEVAHEYGGVTNPGREASEDCITNNSTAIPLSRVTGFEEVKIAKDDLTNLKEKLIEEKVNMLNFSGITRPYSELESKLARQFLRLRSSKPLGIVTDDPQLLKVFLTASAGISPVRATGNEDSVEPVAEEYGGLII